MSYTKDILLALLLIAPVMLVSFSTISFNAHAEQATHTVWQEGELQQIQVNGTGASCPIGTGTGAGSAFFPLSASQNWVLHNSQASADGCLFQTFTFGDDLGSEAHLIPKGLIDFITDFDILLDVPNENDVIGNLNKDCRFYSISESNLDYRINATAAYNAVAEMDNFMAGDYTVCRVSNTQAPQILDGGTSYADSIAVNSTFFQYGLWYDTNDRSTQNQRVRPENVVQRFEFINPTVSTVWNVQEHSKYEGINVQTARVRDLGAGMNLDIGNNGGQIIAFKEFNTTEVGTNDIRITGTFEVTGASTADNYFKVEVRDQGLSMGNVTEFPDNTHELLHGSGKLGSIWLQADAIDTPQAFDLSFSPNWNNSTQEIFTILFGVDDNSAANDISVNVTSLEIDGQVKYDFNTLHETKFWNPTASGDSLALFGQLENSYGMGLVNSSTVTTTGVTGLALPSPNPVTNFKVELDNYDTFRLTWNHDGANSTGYRIEANVNGGGYETLAVLSNPLKVSYTDTNQLDKAKRDIDSNVDAKGYPESTSIDYRIIVLNGDSESSTVTSPNTKTTKADYDPYWELIEHKASFFPNNTPDVDFAKDGGNTNDWLSMKDQTQSFGGDIVSFVYKSFDLDYWNITNVTDFVANIETQCVDITACPLRTQIVIFDGSWNRYDSDVWQERTALLTTAGNATSRTSWGGGGVIGVMGGGSNFEDRQIRVAPDISEVTSGAITVTFSFDHEPLSRAEYDIKNATISNSTTWDFTTGQINFTRNEPNVQTLFSSDQGDQQPRNCLFENNDPLPADTPFRLYQGVDACDRGVMSGTMSPHVELITANNSTSDWQYREFKDDTIDQGHSMHEFSSNSTGFIITNDESPFEPYPWGVGMSGLFKTFTPTSATTFFNATIEGVNLPSGTNGGSISFTVLDTVLGKHETIGRYDNDHFETSANFPSSKVGSFIGSGAACSIILNPSCNEINTGIAVDTSSYIGTPITAMLHLVDTSNLISGQYVIKNVTLNNIVYDFTDGTLFPEEEDTTADRGVFRAGTVIVPPSPTPAPILNASAFAWVENNLITWQNDQTNTTDYTIDRGSFPISTADLKLDYTMDAKTANPQSTEFQVGASSELTNSALCSSSNCNYVVPSGHLGTTQVGYEFASVVDDSIRFGVSTTATLSVNTTNISDWDFLSNDSWTIAYWLDRSSESGKSTLITTINDAGTGSGTVGTNQFDDRDGFALIFNDDTQTATVFTMDGNFTNFNESSPASYLEEDTLPHHYVITHDRGNFVKWYKDGVLIETDSSITTSTGEADIGLSIGNCWLPSACSDGADSTFTGGSIEFPSFLDQTLFFNRVITDTEVSDIYNSGSGLAIEANYTEIVSSLLASNGNITTTAYLDTTPLNNTAYQYQITAQNEVLGFSLTEGNSTLTNSVLTANVPDNVSNLSTTFQTAHTALSDWDSLTDSSGAGSPLGLETSLENYTVFIRDLGVPPYTLDGTATPPTSDFTHSSLDFPQEIEVKVMACNQVGCSQNVTAQGLAFPIANPVLSATTNIINGINATWIQTSGTGIIGYDLYNSTDGITFDLLASVGNNTKFFFDTPHNVCYDQDYRLSAFTPTQNGTNSTASGSTLCDFIATFNNINIENVGDTFKVSGDFDFAGGNLTSLALKENGVITDFNGTFVNYTSLGTPVNVQFVFWERANLPSLTEFNVTATGQDQNFGIDVRQGQAFGTREYFPLHKDAIVEAEGQVNYTHARFNDDDSILLKVNRIGVPTGETWQIECIYQDVIQALDTQDTIVPEVPTVDWIGTWDNTTNTGYFNSTIAGTAGGHVYISCFNDNLLFSTTSFTNSSLALFGIQAFDLTFGSFLGVPVGIFFVILAAGMANKRTAPTWIVVLVAIAGIMSTIGFFTLEPVVWGLALVTAMLGLLVNQKIF